MTPELWTPIIGVVVAFLGLMVGILTYLFNQHKKNVSSLDTRIQKLEGDNTSLETENSELKVANALLKTQNDGLAKQNLVLERLLEVEKTTNAQTLTETREHHATEVALLQRLLQTERENTQNWKVIAETKDAKHQQEIKKLEDRIADLERQLRQYLPMTSTQELPKT